MLGLSLLYVGAVLFINGLWMLGKIDDKEITVVNIFSGGVSLLVSLHLAFSANASLISIKAAALTLLFSLTYFWVAQNRMNGSDGRGLGWFSLFVAITLVPVTIESFYGASSLWGIWFAFCWLGWGLLWFLYFLLLALKRPVLRLTGIMTLLAGIVTGWIPGYLLLTGVLH